MFSERPFCQSYMRYFRFIETPFQQKGQRTLSVLKKCPYYTISVRIFNILKQLHTTTITLSLKTKKTLVPNKFFLLQNTMCKIYQYSERAVLYKILSILVRGMSKTREQNLSVFTSIIELGRLHESDQLKEEISAIYIIL